MNQYTVNYLNLNNKNININLPTLNEAKEKLLELIKQDNFENFYTGNIVCLDGLFNRATKVYLYSKEKNDFILNYNYGFLEKHSYFNNHNLFCCAMFKILPYSKSRVSV